MQSGPLGLSSWAGDCICQWWVQASVMRSTNPANKKVALVTGASSGLGKAFAKALLAEGLIVYAAARRVELMADLASLGAISIKMDITRGGEVQAVVERVETEHGGVDVLINNAGFGMFGAMEDTTIDDAKYQFEVNLFGMARLTQLLLPSMRKSVPVKLSISLRWVVKSTRRWEVGITPVSTRWRVGLIACVLN
jgi:NAD(P)-dependent dehydrogenase (short-subunit alcohol dehydrogenase family)